MRNSGLWISAADPKICYGGLNFYVEQSLSFFRSGSGGEADCCLQCDSCSQWEAGGHPEWSSVRDLEVAQHRFQVLPISLNGPFKAVFQIRDYLA